MSAKLNDFVALLEEATRARELEKQRKAKEEQELQDRKIAEASPFLEDLFNTVAESKKISQIKKEEERSKAEPVLKKFEEALKNPEQFKQPNTEVVKQKVVEMVEQLESKAEELEKKLKDSKLEKQINAVEKQELTELEKKFLAMFKTLQKDFQTLKQFVNTMPRQQPVPFGGFTAGSGEVNLRYLDDVDASNLQDRFTLQYDAILDKFVFRSADAASGSIVDDSIPFTGEPTGFENRTSSLLSFDDATRTFTITPSPSYNLFLRSERIVKTAPQSISIPDVTGIHYFYFDAFDKQLKTTNVFDIAIIEKHAFIAILYWQSVLQKAIYFADERHGIVMDGATHKHFHLTVGAQYRFGLGITNIVSDGDGSLNSHATIAIENGRIADEDLEFDIINNLPQQLSTVGQIPIFYRIGSADNWFKTTADNYPLIMPGDASQYTVGTLPAYNHVVGEQWVLSEVPNNKFFLIHIIATNNTNEPIIAVCGNKYDTKTSVRENAASELLNITGLPFSEFVPIGTIIYESNASYTNDVKTRVVTTADGSAYVDFRKVNLSLTANTITPSFRVVDVSLTGVSQTISLGSVNLTHYYSYRVIDSAGKEVSVAVTENADTFNIQSNVDMNNLILQIRGF